MTELVVHPAAELEYDTAAEWYANQSVVAAERFIAEVEAALEDIRTRPESFALVDDRHRLYLINRFPYYVGYRMWSGRVQVVAIRHSARDQDEWKAR